MKIVVERKAFAAAVSGLARVTERRNTIPILGHALIDARGNGLALTATDLELEATATVAGAAIEEPGALTADIARLAAIATTAVGETMTLQADGADSNALAVRCGRARWTLYTLPSEDWPDISAADPEAVRFDIYGRTLSDLLARARFAVPRDDSRVALLGVFLHPDGDRLVADGTNGHVMSRASVPAPLGAGRIPPVILPPKVVAEVVRRAGQAEDIVSVSAGTQKVRFEAPGWVLTSKLIDATYPELDRLIPLDVARTAVVEYGDLSAALAEVVIVQNGKHNGVRLSFSAGDLALSTSEKDAGEAYASVPCELEGDPVSIGVNTTYLRSVLDALGADTLRIGMNGSGDAFRVTSQAESETREHIVVVMPMRVRAPREAQN